MIADTSLWVQPYYHTTNSLPTNKIIYADEIIGNIIYFIFNRTDFARLTYFMDCFYRFQGFIVNWLSNDFPWRSTNMVYHMKQRGFSTFLPN
jgi:hypothetical protein